MAAKRALRERLRPKRGSAAGLPAPRFLWINSVSARGAGGWPVHRHGDHEIILVEHGTYRCSLNDMRLDLGPGDLLMVLPGDRHEDFLSPPLRYRGLGLRLDPPGGGAPLALLAAGVDPRQQVLRKVPGRVAEIYAALAAEAERGDALSPVAQDALALELLVALLRLVPAESRGPGLPGARRGDPFRATVAAVLAAHLERPAPVALLARAAGMDERAFAARCRAVLRTSPARALRAARLARARDLLAGGAAVAATARALGFASAFHFSRLYHRHFGHPPSLAKTGR